MAFITRYGSVAPIEIQMTFDLTHDELKTVIDSLLNKQLIRKREAGNGYFISQRLVPQFAIPRAFARHRDGACKGIAGSQGNLDVQ